MAIFKVTREDVLERLYCAFEMDMSGEIAEAVVEELVEDGEFSKKEILKIRAEACRLAAKNVRP